MDYPSFSLTAHQNNLVASILNDYFGKLRELVYGLGSPLHIVLPQVFCGNIRNFKNAFYENKISGMVLYAKKANKADCFARSCADSAIGVDVASKEELAKTLASGVVGERIGISGPEKSALLLSLGLRHQCLITIDSISELKRILLSCSELQTTARLLLRVRPELQRSRRFGLTNKECQDAFSLCAEKRDLLRVEGLSFHLSGYSLSDRAKMANRLVDMCLSAKLTGIVGCRYVNIGGGFPVQYVDPKDWEMFKTVDSPHAYHAGKIFSDFYPYGVVDCGAAALNSILNYSVEGGVSLAQKLNLYGISLIIEPGRALLDQAGLSLFRVQGVKRQSAREYYDIVTVEGSSLSLSEQWFNSEFLPNPLLLGGPQRGRGSFLTCVGGSTCLEGDMLTWRKIAFPRAIVPDDCLVYLNTAGYQMDSNESRFHDAPLPRKVVITHFEDAGCLKWYLDDALF